MYCISYMYDPIEVTTIAYARVTPLLMHTLFFSFFFLLRIEINVIMKTLPMKFGGKWINFFLHHPYKTRQLCYNFYPWKMYYTSPFSRLKCYYCSLYLHHLNYNLYQISQLIKKDENVSDCQWYYISPFCRLKCFYCSVSFHHFNYIINQIIQFIKRVNNMSDWQWY